jgi:heat shock protein HslJ
MHGRILGALLVASLILTTGCAGSSDAAGGGDLTGVTWVLDRASLSTLGGTLPKGTRVDMTFDGSQVGGVAACNRYGGGYEADAGAGTLSFGTLATTEMACPGDMMTIESAFLSALGRVTGYAVTGDQAGLQLTGGTAALTFAPERAAPPLPLEGTAWTLTSIAQPQTDAVSSTVAGTTVTLLLRDGTASGTGGCNTYSGPYATSGSDGLSFGPLAATAKGCDAPASDQEGAYLAALGQVATYVIDASELTLSDARGAMLLTFSGREARV